MLISRLLGETGSDPVVCPKSMDCWKRKHGRRWLKLEKIDHRGESRCSTVVISAMNRKRRSIFNSSYTRRKRRISNQYIVEWHNNWWCSYMSLPNQNLTRAHSMTNSMESIQPMPNLWNNTRQPSAYFSGGEEALRIGLRHLYWSGREMNPRGWISKVDYRALNEVAV